jgi:curved DNA-binding protein CbpA
MTQKNESKPAGSQSGSTNYYEILEVSADAPSHEIHRAYQRARETYSQDNPALYSMFSAEEARELLRMIEEAFAVLSNTSLRRSYDESLNRGETAPLIEPQASVPSPASTASHSPTGAQTVAQLKSEHKALPDFASPADSPSEAFSVRKRESAKAELAPGMSKTPVSTFKVDSAFEAEILAATEFDGMLLQRIRVYKNVSLERMSESTRISRPYLTALETNDYKSLPAAVFVRGFVTQVARNLGIDENKAATTYMKRFKAGGGK